MGNADGGNKWVSGVGCQVSDNNEFWGLGIEGYHTNASV